MKNSTVKSMLLPVLVILALTASGQARLILNGAHLVIANNAILVVDNADSNAITRYDGSIISEGEGNEVQWMIGENIGTYTVPWSDGTTYMPLTFTKSAGSGDGSFIFSTFPTPPQNSLNLPSGVTNLTLGGTDRSLYFIDRFWQLNAKNYDTVPYLSNVQFAYIDEEHDVPNSIVELALGAVRWDDSTNNWEGYGPAGDADPGNNVVLVDSIASSDLYSWWSLMGESFLLPIRHLSFNATRQGSTAKLEWKTANDVDVLDFDVQRSVNGNAFNSIGRKPAFGTSGPNVYSYTDASTVRGINAYRIKETHRNGTVYYSETRTIVMESKSGGVTIYPNPVTGNSFTINATGIPAGTYNIQLYGMEGKLVASFVRVLSENHMMMRLDQSIASGMYLLKLTSGGNTYTTRLVVNGK